MGAAPTLLAIQTRHSEMYIYETARTGL